MTDYLESAKNALAVAIKDDDAAIMAEAQALALISIAESLANSSHDARAEAWAKGYQAGSQRTDGPTR